MKEHKGSDVDFDIPMANNISNNTFAVVISNEIYQMEKAVQYAENDGKLLLTIAKNIRTTRKERTFHYKCHAQQHQA